MSLLGDVDVLVLDLDDTLYLERDYVISGFRAVAVEVSRRGLGEVEHDLLELFETGVRNNTFNLALERNGISPTSELVGELVALYRTHLPKIALLSDAERLLARTTELQRSLITDGPAASQQAKIAALGLGSLLNPCIVTAELGKGRSKPDPMAFELVEESTGASGARCVYVGDNPHKDFLAPNRLGWRSVRIRRADSLHYDAESPGFVDLEIQSLDEVL